ncbi:hypothetical protein ABIB82_001482 [Bradyrhizobium sp. i1.8.4]
MAGLVPAIHALLATTTKDVDTRHEAGHDEIVEQSSVIFKATEPYVAAVVTPPSTTIVWPVMKVEASEAR